MARKFFNQKVKKKNTTTPTIVIGAIVGVLIIIAIGVLISTLGKKPNKDAKIELRTDAAVEINSKLPDKTLFFAELENVLESDIKPNYEKVDLTKIGTYDVSIKIYNKTYDTKLTVVDTKSPDLKVKEVKIKPGESYKAEDFVKSCEDNSNQKCKIDFYTLSVNENGEKIDYSKYTEEGTYEIQIIASDESANQTTPKKAKLIIGNSSNIEPQNCKYGNSEYDKSKYTLAINLTQNGCALDLNVYQNEDKVEPVKALINAEQEKLKKEFSKINLNTKDIYLNSDIGAVLNNSGTGLVGYTLKIDVSIQNTNSEKEIIESYYINTNGERQYLINKYLK